MENTQLGDGMNRLMRMIVIVSSLAIAGCSTMEVSYDYDPKAKFSGLNTYDWLDEPQKSTGDPRIDDNTILKSRVQTAVDTALAARGFRKVSSDPDFLVAYHVSLDRQQSVQTLNSYYGYSPGWGYGYGASYRPGYWAGAPETYVYEYEEGTLILDVVDPKSKELMWRGSAQDEVNFKSTPEKAQAQINEAVNGMLEHFPPG
jgi:hypothetical protein